MIVLELTAATDIHGTLTTLYFSSGAFVTSPTDAPPDVAFEPRLIDPGSISLHAYASGQTTTGGGVKLEIGETTLSNADGALDYLLDYGFDGQKVVIRSGDPGTPYPAAWTTLFNGTAENIDTADWRTLSLRLRDAQYVLEVPAQPNLYGGTNALPNGIDGTVNDIAGKAKPRVWGSVFQISAIQVNTSKLTHQVNDGPVQSILVYDRGVILTLGADFANNALLLASTPAAGSYNTCLAEGLFQLGSSPAGTVTADVVQGTPTSRTVAQVLRSIALASGVDPGSVSAPDVAALDLAAPGEIGVYVQDTSTTYLSLMDTVAASVGAWFGFDGTGLLRMGRLTNPAGTPVLSLQDFDVANSIQRLSAYDNNIPVWWVSLKYAKVWTVQTDIAGAAGAQAAFKAYLAQDFRTAAYQDATAKQLHKLATKLEVESLFTQQADATAEAFRQYQLYNPRRDIFEVTIPISLLPAAMNFMDVVELLIDRYGMSSGKLFRLIGISYQLKSYQVTLSLWG